MQGRARQVRDRGLQGIETVVQGQQRVLTEGETMIASSSMLSTVERASFGPVGRSFTAVRFFHLATVFWLTPYAWRGPSGSLNYVVSLACPGLDPGDRLCRVGAPV